MAELAIWDVKQVNLVAGLFAETFHLRASSSNYCANDSKN